MKIYLNVLPEGKKKKARMRKLFSRLFHQEMGMLFLSIFFMLLLGAIWYGLDYQLQNNIRLAEKAEETHTSFKEMRDIEKSFKETNKTVRLTEAVIGSQARWTKAYFELEKSLPPKSELNRLVFKEDYSGILEGVADSRETLVELKESLEQNDCFYDVNVPLSSLVQKVDVNFQIDLKVNKDCL